MQKMQQVILLMIFYLFCLILFNLLFNFNYLSKHIRLYMMSLSVTVQNSNLIHLPFLCVLIIYNLLPNVGGVLQTGSSIHCSCLPGHT